MVEKSDCNILYKSPAGLKIRLHGCDKICLAEQLFLKSCSPEFEAAFKQKFPAIDYTACADDEAIFKTAGINFIPAFLREDPAITAMPSTTPIPALIQPSDIKGIIHSHSDWSDGNHTLEQMVLGAIAKGMEYLVISDHSKTAFYANGLKEDRVKAQHEHIDELNSKLAPFKIFKSIESDILNDGSLDYSDQILSTFDLVIASVHSNLK